MIPKHPSTEQVNSSTFFDQGGGVPDQFWQEAHLLLTCITELGRRVHSSGSRKAEAESTPWEPAPAPALQAGPQPLSLYITHSPWGTGLALSTLQGGRPYTSLLSVRGGQFTPFNLTEPARLAAPLAWEAQLGRLSRHRPKVPGAWVGLGSLERGERPASSAPRTLPCHSECGT